MRKPRKRHVFKIALGGFLCRLWFDEFGRLHRLNGPAEEGSSGFKIWWRNGVPIRQEYGGDPRFSKTWRHER